MATQTGAEKAAMLLSRLPAETVDRVLAELGPALSARLRPELEKLRQRPAPPGDLAGLMREFLAILRQPTPAPPLSPLGGEGKGEGAGAPTPRQLEAYRPPSEADLSLPEESGLPSLPSDPVRALDAMPASLLAAVLDGEQPHTVSLVLNSLDSVKAGEVLGQLTPEMRREVSVRLSRLGATPPELLARIARALVQKARDQGGPRGEGGADSRFEKLANMLRQLEKPERVEVLAALEEKDPETAVRIKELLYQFEDVLRIHDRSMQKLLSEIDSKTLSIALKGASEEISEKVLNNLSRRARETLAEEMEFLGMVPLAQVRQAQKALVDVIQRLDQAGELMMEEE